MFQGEDRVSYDNEDIDALVIKLHYGYVFFEGIDLMCFILQKLML